MGECGFLEVLTKNSDKTIDVSLKYAVQKIKFSVKYLVTITEDILTGKFYFFAVILIEHVFLTFLRRQPLKTLQERPQLWIQQTLHSILVEPVYLIHLKKFLQ